MTKHTYSNPRTEATITDWPSGSKRVTAHFSIETTPRGQRGVRVTTGAPKKLTFVKQARIVDGDDGRTYIIGLTEYGFINVMQSNMQFQEEAVFPRDDGYEALHAMFAKAEG